MRITLSGSLAVDDGELGAGPFRLAGRRPRVAFALLVLERHRPVSRHELADALWPGGLPVSWEPGVRTVLSHIRSALVTAGAPADALRVAFGNYQLHLPPGTVVDLEVAIAIVERSVAAGASTADDLSAATRVLATPFLAGEEGGWVEGVRRHHHVRLLQALDALVEARLLENDVPGALRAAEEAVALEPYREASYVLLMRAHAAGGDRAEALRAYSRCRALLAEELGVSPSPETEEQYLALLGRESAAETRGAPASGSRAPFPSPLAGLAERPLVGRQAELAVIEAASGLVAIRGVLGIGKTHLAAEAARRAHAAGGDVWFGRFDGYLQAAYGPFVDITRSLIRAAAAAGRPVAAGPLSHLAPDLVAPAPWETTDPEVARALLFDAIGDLVSRSVGHAGAVLVLDDLQLAPPTAFALLLHVLTGAAGAGLRVIATWQDSSARPVPEVDEMAAVLGRLPGASEVVLGGLTTDEMEALVRSTGVSEAEAPAVVGRLAALSGGNPLYALTVLRDAASPGDAVAGRGLQELMIGHLRALGDPARRVVEAAAVLGDHTTRALLSATCADLPEPIGPAELSACLDEAVAAGVLESGPGERGGLGFVHGVLRQSLYAQLPAGRRASST